MRAEKCRKKAPLKKVICRLELLAGLALTHAHGIMNAWSFKAPSWGKVWKKSLKKLKSKDERLSRPGMPSGCIKKYLVS